MDSYFNPIPYGLALIGIALIVVFMVFRNKEGPQFMPFMRYILGNILYAFVGAILAYSVGAGIACSGPDASNLCGLSGAFIGAPIGMVLGIAIYIFKWRKRQ